METVTDTRPAMMGAQDRRRARAAWDRESDPEVQRWETDGGAVLLDRLAVALSAPASW